MRKPYTTILFAALVLSLSSSLAEAKPKHRDRVVRCESVEERHSYCPTGTFGSVALARQLSRTPCERYDTWGADGDGSGIWVRNGCRGDFVVREHPGWRRARSRDRFDDDRRYDDRYDGGRRDDDGLTVRCGSKDWGYEHCRVRGGARDARVVRQISDTRCVRGDNWGRDREGIWVDRGCEAIFEIR